jgi:anti-repressor protein
MTELIERFDAKYKTIRVIGPPSEPLYVVKDICKVLNLSNTTALLKSLRDQTMIKHQRLETLKGFRDVSVVTEAGLYLLILKHDKKFNSWICNVLLAELAEKREYNMANFNC